MKNTTVSLFLIIILYTLSIAQPPQSFNYQALIRDANGIILETQNVGIQISILTGTINGSSLYTETHSVSTNQFGLINLKIGMGTHIVFQESVGLLIAILLKLRLIQQAGLISRKWEHPNY
ncbi:MAG: hypothetical protein U9N53_13220 [Bacteroidota bacterium]|nr:hypothetical protein [Bacteroidota bacterium]